MGFNLHLEDVSDEKVLTSKGKLRTARMNIHKALVMSVRLGCPHLLGQFSQYK
jgi:hypothetical protein